MDTALGETDFVEGPLPLDEINPVEFERLIFYLLDEMGFRDLSWRKGGEGNSATDGGRDLEAAFWRVDPVAPEEERYWFEVKYRSTTLEKQTVQKTVLNAAGTPGLDHLVIATNKTISNPCFDWVRKFRKKHHRPRITIWQGHDLELILRKNPRTLAQFFSGSLSLNGKLKVLESKFRNLLYLPSGTELNELWIIQDRLIEEERYELLIATVIAELAHGNINKRPWGISLGRAGRIALSVMAVYKLFWYAYRCMIHNKDQFPILQGISYLIQCMLINDSVSEVYNVLFNTEQFIFDAKPLSVKQRHNIVYPILHLVLDDLAVRCSSRCLKLNYRTEDEETFYPYFYRFVAEAKIEEKEEREGFIVIQSHDIDCPIGMVEETESCPLGEALELDQMGKEEILSLLEFMRSVLIRRTDEIHLEKDWYYS